MNIRTPEVRRTAWSILVAVAAGVVAGALVGGVGGRLAMLVLRLTSPDALDGMTTDDGFEIGVVTFDTVGLIMGLAALGAVNGGLYAILRRGIPNRLRLAVWTVFGATAGGAQIIHDDGVDFTVLEPLLLAIVMFIVLPGLASAAVVLLAERWMALEPFGTRRLTLTLVIVAGLGTLGSLIVALPLLAVMLVVESLSTRRRLAHAATIAVTGVLCLASLGALVDVLSTSAKIL